MDKKIRSSSPDPPPRKYPFSYYLLVFIAFLILISVIGTTAVDYLNAERNFKNNAYLLQNQTEQDIIDAVQVIDAGLKVFDDTLNQQMQDGFTLFMQEYERTGGNTSQIDLEGVKQQLGNRMELYIINDSLVVERTTFTPDQGLDFKQWDYTTEYMQNILTKDGFYPDRVVQEKATGDLKKYAYMPTPDHKYILELGLSENAFNDKRNQLRYTDSIKAIAARNPFIEDVRIFTTEKSLVGNRTFVPEGELDQILDTVLTNRESMQVDHPESGRTLRYLYVDLRDPDYSSDMSLIVEITYNTALIQAALQDLVMYHSLVAILMLFISLGVAVFVSRVITRPIHGMVEDVDRISKGDLDRTINTSGGAEFFTLGQSINSMIGELKGTIQALQESKTSLQASEERYRALVEGQTEFVTRFTPDFTHQFANEAYCRYFGIPCSDIIGHQFFPNIPEEDQARVKTYFASFTPDHPVGSIEHRIVMPDGQIRWQQWTDRAFFESDG
ncbi:MAG TPA: HAMP domain-containing protein, partial [Methanomicrobiales archaeon]|nr:HAMP domain-containing protein [Methanomicrobiales archaeon]